MKTASEMTYTVSSGALNSTQTKFNVRREADTSQLNLPYTVQFMCCEQALTPLLQPGHVVGDSSSRSGMVSVGRLMSRVGKYPVAWNYTSMSAIIAICFAPVYYTFVRLRRTKMILLSICARNQSKSTPTPELLNLSVLDLVFSLHFLFFLFPCSR